jgi:hypothetical protein
VTFAEAGRLWVTFDGLAEHDGLWLDGRDDFVLLGEDKDEGGASARATNGARTVWRPGAPAPSIDALFRIRTAAEASSSSAGVGESAELLVKWKGRAHLHSQWVPRAVLEARRRPLFTVCLLGEVDL